MNRSLWIIQLSLISSILLGSMGCHSSSTAIVPETPPAVMQPAPVPGLSLQQIVEMTQKGNSPNVIMNMISRSNSTYRLSVDDVNYLHQSGVDNSVIEYMQTRTAPPPPPVVGGPPPVGVAPAYVAPAYYPYPPPGYYPYPGYGYGPYPVVGVGFYGRGWR